MREGWNGGKKWRRNVCTCRGCERCQRKNSREKNDEVRFYSSPSIIFNKNPLIKRGLTPLDPHFASGCNCWGKHVAKYRQRKRDRALQLLQSFTLFNHCNNISVSNIVFKDRNSTQTCCLVSVLTSFAPKPTAELKRCPLTPLEYHNECFPGPSLQLTNHIAQR